MNQWGYSLLARVCIARPPRVDIKSLPKHIIVCTCKQAFPTWPNQVAGLAASRTLLITNVVSPSIFLERYIHYDLDAYPSLMLYKHTNRKLHVIILKSSLPKVMSIWLTLVIPTILVITLSNLQDLSIFRQTDSMSICNIIYIYIPFYHMLVVATLWDFVSIVICICMEIRAAILLICALHRQCTSPEPHHHWI